MTHAFLAPSGADQWGPGRCSASPRLQAQFPEPEGEEAKEGTVAHDYSAEAIRGVVMPVGSAHHNGKVVTIDMPEACEAYIDDCIAENERALATLGAIARVEERVYAHKFIHPECDGTPDFFAIFPQERRIVLKDFKYGHGYIDAWRCYQLAVYLIAIFETHIGEVPSDAWTIEAAIYQPRNYHHSGPVRYWRPTGSELEEMRVLFMRAAVEATMPDAIARVGNWCYYCTAAHACEVLAAATSHMRSYAGKAVTHVANGDALGREMAANEHALKLLKARQEALKEQALAQIRAGERVRGWGGEWTKGRETWSVDADRVVLWCEALGVDVSKPGVLTPVQAKKKGLTPELIEGITTTPSTYVLVRKSMDEFAKGLK